MIKFSRLCASGKGFAEGGILAIADSLHLYRVLYGGRAVLLCLRLSGRFFHSSLYFVLLCFLLFEQNK